ncbi:hypothetical protein IW261DRAFT_1612997 [Armillaria novae-zelandiae]|uniref:Extracellular membrane protein CFEM domain-containing protein n=1 Tax=Armillaria novae-zelandiae TaxID=153914 RepID=A0AA39TNE0_9AGAR|nr:hypothetical protein IW261DRAFT_1532776 [Armillaria novae-zelandiae]KAK0467535.1 hypothetical protein IW261DRAFT_1612997 [Armillaria novae-zelandiae]
MFFSRLLFLAVGIFATQIYAVITPLPREVPTSIGPLLFARQSSGSVTSSIPSQCANSCAILDTLANCDGDDLNCACSNSDSDQYAGCMDCLVRLDNSVQTQAQQAMDTYVDLCKEAGITIKSQRISGAGRVTIGASAMGVVLMTVLAILQ